MIYQTMKSDIIGADKMGVGNNEQIVKAGFGCYAESENTQEKRTISLLTCSNKYAINVS